NQRALSLGQCSQYDTDGTLPDHQHRLVRFKAQAFYSLQAGIDRLEKTGLLVRNTIRNSHRALADDPVHHPHIVREPAARRLKASRAAYSFVGFALREGLAPAIETVATRNVMKHHHPVAWLKVANAFTHSRNRAGRFMSEDARRRVRTG